MLPWNDRLGRFSPLRAIVFPLLFVPAGWILYQWHEGLLFPRELNELIHQTGLWAIRLLLLALLVTPLRHAGQWAKLFSIRRMVGLAALAYTLAHLVFYAADQQFDLAHITAEILQRVYLTIGFIALFGLVLLGATSTDGMIKRLGPLAWMRLHKLVHPIAVLSVLHFYMQSKIDTYEATLMLGLLLILEGCRVLVARRQRLGLVPLSGLAAVAAILTAGLEAGWYAVATKVPPLMVLAANLDLAHVIRPAWWVLAAGLGLALVGAVRNRGGSANRKIGRMATAGA